MMSRLIRPLLLIPALLAFATSCLGDNPEGSVDLEKLIDSYQDRGRTAVDPLTPGLLTLTFDDGPNPDTTPFIIDTLARHRVTATFFWVGRLIPGNRDIVQKAFDLGQQVASHSYNHEPQPSLPQEVFKQRVAAVKRNIGELDQHRLYFRFPYGAANEDQLAWLREVDIGGKFYRPVGWHLDSQDFDFNVGYPAAPFSKNILDDDALADEGRCEGQANPFQADFVGWSLFIARKIKGGVMLFHDTKEITRDKLEEFLNGIEQPERYWPSLPEAKRNEYGKYYDCQKTDRFLRFQYRPLHDGTYPSLRD